MLVCKDALKQRINVTSYTKEQLKSMSKNNELHCPECEEKLIYCHGTIKVPYFRHKIKTDCDLDLKGETDEHRKGKMLLYEMAKRMFPNAYVDMEYKIIETNQRADVICIQPDGHRIIFEMQCSKIQPDIWQSRYQLYKLAGIEHYWIVGKNIVWPTYNYSYKSHYNLHVRKYEFTKLADQILYQTGYCAFLNVTTQEFHLLYKTLNVSYPRSIGTVFREECLVSMEDIYLENGMLLTDPLKIKLFEVKAEIKEKEKLRKQEMQRELNAIEQEKTKEKEKIDERVRRNIEKLEYSKKYVNLIRYTDVIYSRSKMTENERVLFDILVKKHNYSVNSFPGIFCVIVNCLDLIKTPTHLWQLWLYDTFIYSIKDSKYNKVYVPNVYTRFKDMVKKGVFRVENKKIDEEHYSFAIWDYFSRLSKVEILSQLGNSSRDYFRINLYDLPEIKSNKQNKLLSLALSNLNHHYGIDTSKYLNIEKKEAIDLNSFLFDYVQMVKEKRKSTLDLRVYSREGIVKTLERKPVINTNPTKIVNYIFNLYENGLKMKLSSKGYELICKYRNQLNNGEVLDEISLENLMKIVEEVEAYLNFKIIINNRGY